MNPMLAVVVAIILFMFFAVAAVYLWTSYNRRRLNDREFAMWVRKAYFGVTVPELPLQSGSREKRGRSQDAA